MKKEYSFGQKNVSPKKVIYSKQNRDKKVCIKW